METQIKGDKKLVLAGKNINRLLNGAIEFVEDKTLYEVHSRFEKAQLWTSNYFVKTMNGKQLKTGNVGKYKIFKLEGHFMIDGQDPCWIKILAKKSYGYWNIKVFRGFGLSPKYEKVE